MKKLLLLIILFTFTILASAKDRYVIDTLTVKFLYIKSDGKNIEALDGYVVRTQVVSEEQKLVREDKKYFDKLNKELKEEDVFFFKEIK